MSCLDVFFLLTDDSRLLRTHDACRWDMFCGAESKGQGAVTGDVFGLGIPDQIVKAARLATSTKVGAFEGFGSTHCRLLHIKPHMD